MLLELGYSKVSEELGVRVAGECVCMDWIASWRDPEWRALHLVMHWRHDRLLREYEETKYAAEGQG